jgi:hypothetical protein
MQLFDGNREKCARYFPSEPGQGISCPRSADPSDVLTCTLLETSLQAPSPVASLWRLSKLSISRSDGTAVAVSHLEFMAWPDHGIPASPEVICQLYTCIAALAPDPATDPPILVHCSAGVGRTGTFIALSNLLAQLPAIQQEFAAGGQTEDAVSNVIDHLREQRCMSGSSLDWLRKVTDVEGSGGKPGAGCVRPRCLCGGLACVGSTVMGRKETPIQPRHLRPRQGRRSGLVRCSLRDLLRAISGDGSVRKTALPCKRSSRLSVGNPGNHVGLRKVVGSVLCNGRRSSPPLEVIAV